MCRQIAARAFVVAAGQRQEDGHGSGRVHHRQQGAENEQHGMHHLQHVDRQGVRHGALACPNGRCEEYRARPRRGARCGSVGTTLTPVCGLVSSRSRSKSKAPRMIRLPVWRLLSATCLGLAAGAAMAAEIPGADAKPLSQLLEGVARSQPGMIVSAEFDERRWEILSCEPDGRSYRGLRVDPGRAKTLRESRETNFDLRPPAAGKSAAQIAQAVEALKLGAITELEFDDPVWEVEVHGKGVRAKLYVDPLSGEVQRCRGCPAR